MRDEHDLALRQQEERPEVPALPLHHDGQARLARECPVKEVNANHIEEWVREQIGKLAADGELLDAAVAAANADDDRRTEPLRREQAEIGARISETRTKVDRLVDAVAEGGAGFQTIRAKLTLEERNLRLLEHDLTRVKTEIDRVGGEPLDAGRLHHALRDFDALFAVANADERERLLKLLIKRIVFRGAEAEVTMELFSSVNLGADSSIFRASWLRRRGLNPAKTLHKDDESRGLASVSRS